MADIDNGGPLAPDSELDPPIGVDPVYYTARDGGVVDILPNDWVDLACDETGFPLDPLWGSSFQVLQCYPETLTVKMLNFSTTLYEEVEISPEMIWNNFRRQPKVYAE